MRLIFAVLAFAAICSAHDFTECAGITDHLHVSSVTLTPDPVQAGKTLSVLMKGKTDEAITSGTATLKISIIGIVVVTLNFDICKVTTCPVAANAEWSGIINYDIPAIVPAGISADCEVDVVTGTNNDEIACVKMSVTIANSSAPAKSAEEALFQLWQAQHNVQFGDFYNQRLAVFSANHRFIMEHNAGNHTYSMGHNEYSALSSSEFKTRMGFKRAEKTVFRQVVDLSGVVTVPTSVDWVAAGAVTPVKNQQQCGSCWAFSTTGSLEGAHFLKSKVLTSLSEQQLVDCDRAQDQGCNGGLMDNAFTFIESNGGLCTEASYPYTAVDGTCQTTCSDVSVTKITKFVDVATNEDALLAAVTLQPVSIAIEADQQGFQFYSSGVFDGDCGQQLDHGVLAVGFGTDAGKDYWAVKNSWGATWGEKGFIRLVRGKNQCGLTNAASYPIV